MIDEQDERRVDRADGGAVLMGAAGIIAVAGIMGVTFMRARPTNTLSTGVNAQEVVISGWLACTG
ncbi:MULTISPECIES: hypothetical protein [unclassified Microbacterium]|uniref:hypothetical protein n=1 Tax=unclassified Microbacterium TaxID=2609290 RepID=UPI003140481B